MGEARTGVPLEELDITDTRIRRAQTGSLLVEIPGKDKGGFLGRETQLPF